MGIILKSQLSSFIITLKDFIYTVDQGPAAISGNSLKWDLSKKGVNLSISTGFITRARLIHTIAEGTW
jgi:hypothetical protein